MMNQWLKTPNFGKKKQRKQNSEKVESLHYSYNKGTIDYEISHSPFYSISLTCIGETYQLSESRRFPESSV